MTQTFQIPDKATYRIGEVAKMLELEAYVLRYWETEFDQLSPEKTKSGQRIYTPEDIRLLARIRDMLHVDMFTIAGARRQLELDPEGALNVRVSGEALEALHEQIEALQAERDALAVQAAQVDEAKAAAAAQLAQHEEALEEARRAQEISQGQVETLRQELDTARERLEERARQITALEASDHEEVEERWQAMVAQLQTKITFLEEDLQLARQRNLEVRQQRDLMGLDHEALRRETRHQRQRRRELISAISTQLSSLTSLAQQPAA